MLPRATRPVVAATGLGLLAGLVTRLSRVQVQGGSMLPTLAPGDRLLVWRARRLRPGDLAVVAEPRGGEREVVKRVQAVTHEGLWIVGDNGGASTDSRTYGHVPATSVRGRAFYRYFPRERAGRMQRGAGPALTG